MLPLPEVTILRLSVAPAAIVPVVVELQVVTPTPLTVQEITSAPFARTVTTAWDGLGAAVSLTAKFCATHDVLELSVKVFASLATELPRSFIV